MHFIYFFNIFSSCFLISPAFLQKLSNGTKNLILMQIKYIYFMHVNIRHMPHKPSALKSSDDVASSVLQASTQEIEEYGDLQLRQSGQNTGEKENDDLVVGAYG